MTVRARDRHAVVLGCVRRDCVTDRRNVFIRIRYTDNISVQMT